jgi:hypothetical protein
MTGDWLSADRDLLLERIRTTTDDMGLIQLGPSLWPTKPMVKRLGLFRVFWKVVDLESGEIIASGYRPTARWALHEQDKAAKRIHDERAEAAR